MRRSPARNRSSPPAPRTRVRRGPSLPPDLNLPEELSRRWRFLLGGGVTLAVVALAWWQGVVLLGQGVLGFFGIGLPLALGWGASYAYVRRRWPLQDAESTYRWLGALSLGLGLLGLFALVQVPGGVAFFPFQSGLGAALGGGPLWAGLLRLLVLSALGVALLRPRASLALAQQAARRGALAASRVSDSVAERLGRIRPRWTLPIALPNREAASPTSRESRRRRKILEEEPVAAEEPLPLVPLISIVRSQTQLSMDELMAPPSLQAAPWRLPSLSLLEQGSWEESDDEEHLERAGVIQKALEEYGIEAQVVEIRPGPTVTQYGVRPGWQRRYRETIERDEQGQPLLDGEGRLIIQRQETSRTRVKVDRIAALDKDLSLALAAPIRIETPVPGTNMVGIEVPNSSPRRVPLRPVMESVSFRKMASRTRLAVPIGVGPGGECLAGDLTQMPHLLIAGATGSGKSVFISSFLSSLLLHASPEDVHLLLVDPKRVELTRFDEIPHLVAPVLIDPEAVVNALRWSLVQMEERLDLLAQARVRDIQTYNRRREDRLPYLVLVIDELADLMMTSGKSVELSLCRLAQMGRATGIHLVVATQRPSVDVVTGLIKANFPSRLSFAVSSFVDSRTILDMGGAEKLIGRGDLFYLPQDASYPVRVQGAYVADEEVERLVDFWRAQSGGHKPLPLPDMGVEEALGQEAGGTGRSEPLLEEARALAERYGSRLSTSLLQRRLGIGYPRAARLKDFLVAEGSVPDDDPPPGRGGSGLGDGGI